MGRALEDVEEFSERQKEQRGNHRDGVQDGEETYEEPRSHSCETVSASPVTEMANSRMIGRKSMPNCWTARAPASVMRRQSERAIPASTTSANVESVEQQQAARCAAGKRPSESRTGT